MEKASRADGAFGWQNWMAKIYQIIDAAWAVRDRFCTEIIGSLILRKKPPVCGGSAGGRRENRIRKGRQNLQMNILFF